MHGTSFTSNIILEKRKTKIGVEHGIEIKKKIVLIYLKIDSKRRVFYKSNKKKHLKKQTNNEMIYFLFYFKGLEIH